MDMRWIVLIKKHADNDSKKSAYFRHSLAPTAILSPIRASTTRYKLFSPHLRLSGIYTQNPPSKGLKDQVPSTAVTYARRLAIIVGSRSALQTAIRRTDSRGLCTGLAERLRAGAAVR